MTSFQRADIFCEMRQPIYILPKHGHEKKERIHFFPTRRGIRKVCGVFFLFILFFLIFNPDGAARRATSVGYLYIFFLYEFTLVVRAKLNQVLAL